MLACSHRGDDFSADERLVEHRGGHLVISQVYGAGGVGPGAFPFDFVELFNPTRESLPIDNLSLQAAGRKDAFRVVLNFHDVIDQFPVQTVPPGGYVRVTLNEVRSAAPDAGRDVPDAGQASVPEEDAGTAETMPSLPTGDIRVLDPTSGKVALVQGGDPLTCGAAGNRCSDQDAQASTIVDLVGYGENTSDFEGAPAVGIFRGASGIFNGVVRRSFGCRDTNNNAEDFLVARAKLRPHPHRCAASENEVSPDTEEAGTSATTEEVDSGVTPDEAGMDAGSEEAGASTVSEPGLIVINISVIVGVPLSGQDGVNGEAGPPGKDGLNGKDGANGKDGVNGVDGKDGVNGKDGVDGKGGPPGSTGAKGESGAAGAPGERGSSGGCSVGNAAPSQTSPLTLCLTGLAMLAAQARRKRARRTPGVFR